MSKINELADSLNKMLQKIIKALRKFFDKITEEMQPYLNPDEGRPSSKVAGGRPAASASAGGERKRTFADLPAEAKEACTRQARKLVGPGRAFKDDAAWQAHYVEQYFLQE
mgnify:CR=1 FL=1